MNRCKINLINLSIKYKCRNDKSLILTHRNIQPNMNFINK